VNRAYRGALRNGLRVLLVAALAVLASTSPLVASSARANREAKQWIGTWATAPQAPVRGRVQTFRNQTLRLIVHTSAPGKKVRIKIRSSGKFDGIDFDEAVHDPSHPIQLLPTYDSGDHLHVNDAGNVAQANAIPLALFHVR